MQQLSTSTHRRKAQSGHKVAPARGLPGTLIKSSPVSIFHQSIGADEGRDRTRNACQYQICDVAVVALTIIAEVEQVHVECFSIRRERSCVYYRQNCMPWVARTFEIWEPVIQMPQLREQICQCVWRRKDFSVLVDAPRNMSLQDNYEDILPLSVTCALNCHPGNQWECLPNVHRNSRGLFNGSYGYVQVQSDFRVLPIGRGM